MRTVVRLPVVDGLGQTLRRDNWWVAPLVTFLALTVFVVYAAFRALEGSAYTWGPYVSPLASPYFETKGFGVPLLTPATLVLPIPALFRLTCYAHRQAYYRAFFMSPPACSVGAAPSARYEGERKLAFLQVLHRWTLYLALVFLVMLWLDFARSLSWEDRFGAGVGSFVILVNCTLLSAFTFSCHSFRHLVGRFTGARLGFVWRGVSKLTEHHALLGWASLASVCLTDVYVRSIATGAWMDFRLF
ncbi:MAG: hypothetical protein KIT84_11975 [Labilithrix sp.]|nr:hypothetical protein [Labilithrix sp.]MCW5811729.1 hypothetical protein [Labilithrix sp.]